MSESDRTRESQYRGSVPLRDREGFTRLGLVTNQSWEEDPRRLLFRLARYKFVSKMLSGRDHVLEVGCADGFGTRLVLQEVKKLTAIDFDPLFVQEAQETMGKRWVFECRAHDLEKDGPVPGSFDGAFALDVLEHVPKEKEDAFLESLIRPLTPHGVLVLGMPSVQSQAYAKKEDLEVHVNCKEQSEFKALLEKFFHNVFMFSMNDEVVHTGFSKMAHYLFAVACSKK